MITKPEFEELKNYYEKEIKSVEQAFGKELDASIKRHLINNIMEKSVMGSFILPSQSYAAAKNSYSAGICLLAGLDHLYRSAMGKRAQDMFFFEKFDEKTDRLKAIECLSHAPKFKAGNDNETAAKTSSLILENTNTMVDFYENINLSKDYHAYNLKNYSILQLLFASAAIKKLPHAEIANEYIIEKLDEIKTPYIYLMNNYTTVAKDRSDYSIYVDDKDVSIAITNLQQILDSTGGIYGLSVNCRQLPFNTGTFIHSPLRQANKTQPIDEEYIQEVKRTIDSTRTVEEFLNMI